MIYIFKTSVQTENDILKLKPQLNELCTWSFDLDDCDKVLRIEGQTGMTHAFMALLHGSGFECEELL
jgi:hypothetical protein